MSKAEKKATEATETTEATEAANQRKRATRGTSKQARAIAWMLEAFNYAITNGKALSDELIEAGTAIAAEFTTTSSKSAAVRLEEVKTQINAIYEAARTDISILQERQPELQALFAQKDKIEKRMERTKAERKAKANAENAETPAAN